MGDLRGPWTPAHLDGSRNAAPIPHPTRPPLPLALGVPRPLPTWVGQTCVPFLHPSTVLLWLWS